MDPAADNSSLNIAKSPAKKKIKKRLSDGTMKEYSYKTRPRKQLDLFFESDACKLEFEEKLKKVKVHTKSQTHSEVFSALLDKYLSTLETEEKASPAGGLNEEYQETQHFICSRKKLEELINITGSFVISEYRKAGHVCELGLINPENNTEIHWQSSE